MSANESDLATLLRVSGTPDVNELCLALLPFREPLPESVAATVLDSLVRIPGGCDRADAVMMLRPLVPESLFPRLSHYIGRLHDDEYLWDDLLVRLGILASDEQLPRVLELIRGTENEGDRARALFRLLPRCPDLLGEVIREARAVTEPTTRSYLLSKLVAHDASVLEEALAAIEANPYEVERVPMLQACLDAEPEKTREALAKRSRPNPDEIA
jgi:hypothetical protein